MPDVALAEQVAVPAADAESFFAGIAALLPELRARAGQTERAGGVPDDIIQALTDADVFRAMQPRQWGGLELDHASFYQGMVLIASACASTGWVASVVGVHAWQIALFADEAQREVWGDDADARASSSLAPTGSVGGSMAGSICPAAGTSPAASIIADGRCWGEWFRTRATAPSSAPSSCRAGISRSTTTVGTSPGWRAPAARTWSCRVPSFPRTAPTAS
jgi:hypothetical protein